MYDAEEAKQPAVHKDAPSANQGWKAPMLEKCQGPEQHEKTELKITNKDDDIPAFNIPLI